MDKSEIEDYLYYEFDVLSPSELSQQDKYIAYERLKHKLIERNPTPDEYTSSIIKLSEVLEV
jgi:hypothetical protein